MTKEEAIADFKRSIKLSTARLEVEKMRMDMDEIKELEFYIERNQLAVKALEEQEPKIGYWTYRGQDTYECSECGKNHYGNCGTPYCENCGSRMIGTTRK